MVQGLRTSSLPGTFHEADFAEYRRAWSEPGAMTAMVNWYRAALRVGAKRPRHARIITPTLILWGARDKFIGREAAAMSESLCDQGQLAMFEHNTHWLPHEEPQEVTRRIIEFCGRDSPPAV
jgi:pimeloyl-ACP methyl ester carboxylesterase